MATYQTEQKKALVDFLCRNASRALRADEVVKELKEDARCGLSLPKSTVYRLLSQLVASGAVRRTVQPGEKCGVYRWLQPDCCEHLHLKCVDCDRLIHLDAQESVRLRAALEQSGFEIDPRQTTIFGHCKACREGKHEKA